MSLADKRAGDDDRKAVAEQLRVALEEGRLEIGEYDERVQAAYSAKTYGELDELLTDIPGVTPVGQSQLEPLRTRSKSVDDDDDDDDDEDENEDDWSEIRSMWGGWAIMATILVGIWAITFIAGDEEGVPYFWPIWPLGFTALGMSVATVTKFFGRD